jgi:integrase
MSRTTKRARRGRGEASIFQRESDGLWVGTVSLGYDGEGKRVRKTVYAPGKGEVAEKLRAVQAEHDAGRLVDAEEMTTGEYLRQWLVVAKDQTGAATFNGYRILAEKYLIPALGRIKLAKLRPLHVQGIYAELCRTDATGEKVAATANTRKAAGVVLGIALRNAVRMKLIPSNPAADVKKPRGAFREMLFMTPPQAKRFLEAARQSRNFALYATAIGTGMRQGELLGLTWPDIDFDGGTLDVRRSLSQVKSEFIVKEPKSRSSRRSIALPQFVLVALRDHRAAALKAGHITQPIFCASTGAYLRRSNVLRNFRAVVKRANADTQKAAGDANAELDQIPAELRFHDLRHSHASGLIAAGHSIKAVSRRLGHADIAMTLKVYAHLMPDDDAKLASGAGTLFG